MRELTKSEKQALMKLPVSLRSMLASYFKWPELGVDRRGKHWSEKREASGPEDYVVEKPDGRLVSMTLAAAAEFVGTTADELAKNIKRTYSHRATYYVRGGEVAVTQKRRSASK